MNFRYILYTFIIITSFVFIPMYNYTPVQLEIVSSNDFFKSKEPNIAVYNDSNREKITSYYQLGRKQELIIHDQQVWGICLKDQVMPISIKLNGKLLNMKRVSASSNGCYFESNIKVKNKKFYSEMSILLALLANIWILIIILVIEKAYRLLINKKVLLEKPYCIFVLIQIIYYFIFYPGLYNSDFSHAANLIKSSVYNDWFSFLNVLYLGSLFKLGIGLGAIQLPIILLGSYVVWLYYKLVSSLDKSVYLKYIILFFFSLPSIGMFNNFLVRDVMVLYSHLLAAYFVLKSKYGNIVFKYESVVFLITIIFSGLIRREGVIFFILMLFVYTSFQLWGNKQKFKYIFTGIFFFVLTQLIGTHLIKDNNQFARKEKITFTLAHYIGSIISTDYFSDNKKNDKEIINKYFVYDILKKEHVHYDVLGLHLGARKWKGSPSLNELYNLTFKMVLENPQPVLENRFKMFAEVLYPTEFLYIFSDDYMYYMHNNKNDILSNQLRVHELKNDFSNNVYETRNWLKEYLLSDSIKFIYGLSLSFLLIIFTLFFLGFAPILFFTSIPFLVKGAIMFVLMQKAQFQYFADIYMFGFLLIPFLIYEIKKLRLT